MNARLLALGLGLACLIATSSLHAQVPQIINYQGRVVVGTTNFNGSGSFKFALVNNSGSTTYWSNDGSSTAGAEPTNAVSLAVANGLYSVLLGDTAITNMTVAIPASVFTNNDVRLRVWFNDGTHGSQLLAPDQRIASVGYAAMAANVPDGAITSAKIANAAVGTTQIANGAVGAAQIAAGAVGSAQIDGSIPRLSGSNTFNGNNYFTGGNVGIGTTTPGAPLEIKSSSSRDLNLNSTNPSGAYATWQLNGSDEFFIGKAPNVSANGLGYDIANTVPNSALSLYSWDTNGYIRFFTGGPLAGNERMRIDNAGSVGIGTTNPQFKLDVAGNVQARGTVNLLNSGSTQMGALDTAADTYGYLRLTNAGTTNVLIQGSGSSYINSGNVGIGKTNPATALDVNGTVTASSFSGNLSGNATTASSFTGSLAGDVTGTQGATVVSLVGTSTAANVHAGELAANSATSANTASTIVKRDGSGNFSAGTITAAGDFSLPATTGASAGVITQNGARLVHAYGSNNFFAGSGAGNFTMTGSSNTATGVGALGANTTGFNNTASGYNALQSNTTAFSNTASGYNALQLNTTGTSNTANGAFALQLNTTGTSNTASGAQALQNNTASNNTAHGAGALQSNTSGTGNTATGRSALGANTAGFQNTANGAFALSSNNANYNTANGYLALSANTSGAFNTASGNEALAFNTTGGGNTANGASSLRANTTGGSNTASGLSALSSNTTGNFNTASGAGALQFNSTGFQNTASGRNALLFNSTGSNNTAQGYQALSNNTASNNTANGASALQSNTGGASNTGDGYQALFSNTTGFNNMASGYNALVANTTGNFNTANGWSALASNTTGSHNIALGDGAGGSLTTGDNNIDIGHAGIAGEAGVIRIGTAGTHTTAFIAGVRGVTTGVNDAVAVVIDSNGQFGTISSSWRYKEDIADMGDLSARLQALRPVTFRYKEPYANGEKPIQYGLIAEEVAEVFPELTVFNAEGQPETVKYQDLTPLLLNELQKLRTEKDAEIAAMHAEIEKLRRDLAAEHAAEADWQTRLSKLEEAVAHANSVEKTQPVALQSLASK